MGNKPSKLSKSGRVLAQKTKESANIPHAQSTRLGAQKHQGPEPEEISNAGVAQRLQKLGQVQYKQMEEKFKPASEDGFTMTLEARQKIEDQNAADLEKGGLRNLLPASTITSILTSLKEGDSAERINQAFSLDPSVLPKLQRLSIPQIVQHEVANQLSENTAQRQPMRRKRKTN